LSDGQAAPTTHALYVPVQWPTWAGLETLIKLIEMSDQPRARHDFNLVGPRNADRSGLEVSSVGVRSSADLPGRYGFAQWSRSTTKRAWSRPPLRIASRFTPGSAGRSG
jgi:hypothetical protein